MHVRGALRELHLHRIVHPHAIPLAHLAGLHALWRERPGPMHECRDGLSRRGTG